MRQRIIMLLVVLTLLSCNAVLCLPPLQAASVAITNARLVDRQCSVEDALQMQPLFERYCTLTFEESSTVNGVTYKRLYTVYCPNLLLRDGLVYNSYETCADPGGMQIRNLGAPYIVVGVLRTEDERVDRRGDILGSQFQF